MNKLKLKQAEENKFREETNEIEARKSDTINKPKSCFFGKEKQN